MRLGRLFGLTKQTEILVLSFFGIVCTILDASLLDFRSNLRRIWNVAMDPSMFSDHVELYMKYLLTGVVLIRTFTVHIYLACYVVLLYPAYFGDRPGLLLPWIFVNAVKCLLTAFLSLSAGIYTCMVYRFIQPTCWEFVLTQIFDHGPSLYMFCIVISYYRDLKALLMMADQMSMAQRLARQRQSRAYPQSAIGPPSSDPKRYLESVSTAGNVLLHLTASLGSDKSLSLDRLLGKARSEDEHQVTGSSHEDDLQVHLSAMGETTSSLQLVEDVDVDKVGTKELLLEEFGTASGSKSFDSTHLGDLLVEPDVRSTTNQEILSIPSEFVLETLLPVISLEAEETTGSTSEALPVVEATFVPEVDEATMTVEDNRRSMQIQTRIPSTGVKKRLSTLTNPQDEKNPSVTTTSQMEGSLVPITEVYKNKASYPTGYQDDGYTLAYFDNIDKNRRKSAEEIKDKDGFPEN